MEPANYIHLEWQSSAFEDDFWSFSEHKPIQSVLFVQSAVWMWWRGHARKPVSWSEGDCVVFCYSVQPSSLDKWERSNQPLEKIQPFIQRSLLDFFIAQRHKNGQTPTSVQEEASQLSVCVCIWHLQGDCGSLVQSHTCFMENTLLSSFPIKRLQLN